MPRHRLGVVLLLPRNIAPEIDGLRRALGDTLADRVPPHITLVPPVNVNAERLDDALALIRRVAADEPAPIELTIGPVTTFHPVTPVVYLGVSGAGLDAVRRLQSTLTTTEPLVRPADYPFGPHVTLADQATPEEIDGALASLGHYSVDVSLDLVSMLEEGDDKVWRQVGDAPLGAPDPSRVVGADRVTFAVHAQQTTAAVAMGRYRPLVVEAFVAGRTVGVARGRVANGDLAWLDELIVVAESRGTGLGGALAREFADAARARKATELRTTRGATIAGFLVRIGFELSPANEFVLAL